jgi:hypothetical protein
VAQTKFWVRFVVDKPALGQVFLSALGFFPVTTIPPMLHNHLHLHVAVNQSGKWAKPGNLPKSNGLSEIGKGWVEKSFHSYWVNI